VVLHDDRVGNDGDGSLQHQLRGRTWRGSSPGILPPYESILGFSAGQPRNGGGGDPVDRLGRGVGRWGPDTAAVRTTFDGFFYVFDISKASINFK
jgi:hypothetical protein